MGLCILLGSPVVKQEVLFIC